jgi:hypothetical protein
MELTAQLPALLAAFMLAAMLVLSIERFPRTVRCVTTTAGTGSGCDATTVNPGVSSRPHPRPRPIRRDDFWLWSGW